VVRHRKLLELCIVTLRDFRISTGVFAASLLLLVAGLALLAGSVWLRPIAEAEQAMRDGNRERAVDRYAAARERFDRIPIARSLLPRIHRLVTENELALDYALERYDDILERAGTSDGDEAASFWAGCALFNKGLIEQRPEARVGWIAQAHQEFRKALELAPEDWDAKVNFEMTGKLVSGLQKQPASSTQDMMKLLREAPRTDRQPVKKAG
jgi:tetratricopeptide (TPR) repeat protein